MMSDLERIIESKRALRRQLASLSIGEKLRMLDVMCECEIAICRAQSASHSRDRVNEHRPRHLADRG